MLRRLMFRMLLLLVKRLGLLVVLNRLLLVRRLLMQWRLLVRLPVVRLLLVLRRLLSPLQTLSLVVLEHEAAYAVVGAFFSSKRLAQHKSLLPRYSSPSGSCSES